MVSAARRAAILAGEGGSRSGGGRGSGGRGSIAKEHAYMTREAARRLRLAKSAAAAIRKKGGSEAQAAAAAQAFGTPCDDGSGSDVSDGSESADEDDDQASRPEAQLGSGPGGANCSTAA
jgi:hypothetical protein